MAVNVAQIKHWLEVGSWVVAVGTVVVTAWAWLLDSDNRTKIAHYQAWSVINTAVGSTGDGGRRTVLQDLNGDRVDLTAAPLADAYLKGVQLAGADLYQANLARADLQDADLRCADLSGADLTEANLTNTNLSDALLYGAKLDKAHFNSTNLTGASMYHASLVGTSFFDSKVEGAQLCEARLSEKDWGKCEEGYDDATRRERCKSPRKGRPDHSRDKSGWVQIEWRRPAK